MKMVVMVALLNLKTTWPVAYLGKPKSRYEYRGFQASYIY